jgi:hypothetical protein
MSNQASAEQWLKLISPLLALRLDPGKFQELKRQIVQTSGLSERTVHRYHQAYRAKGFAGLEGKECGRNIGRSIPANVPAGALLLRREVPGRNVNQIIRITPQNPVIPAQCPMRALAVGHQVRVLSSPQLAAIDAIYRFSSDVPRIINNACTHCLIYGVQNRQHIIDDHMVGRVLEGEAA